MDIQNFLSCHHFSEATKRTYEKILARILEPEPDPATLSAPVLLKLIANQGWGNARQCLALACCQKYLSWKFGHSHPALSAKLKRTLGKVPRAISKDQALVILASFNTHSATGARNLALFAMAFDTGLRLSELCRLQQADTDTEQKLLQVVVKGGNWEFAVFSRETANYIEHWKKFRAKLSPRGELFCNVLTGKGLTPAGLQSVAAFVSRKTGIKFSMHDFRRGFAVEATLKNAPEYVLMLGGRWKSGQMAHRYTRTLKLEAMRQFLPLENDDAAGVRREAPRALITGVTPPDD